LVASTRYIKSYGQPSSPDELSQFRCIGFGQQWSGRDVWTLTTKERLQKISFKPVLRSDDMATILQITRSGGGIALIPLFVCLSRFIDSKKITSNTSSMERT
jgi:DNA-binding transcriptional LysR family regulator